MPKGLPPEVYTASLGGDGRRRSVATVGPKRKNGNLLNLWQRNHEIINLHVSGFKNTEIAEILNISLVTVSNTINSTVAVPKIDELRKERDKDAVVVQERIRILRNKALDVYDEVLTKFEESEDGTITERAVPMSTKLRVADTVMLEFSGFRVPVKTETKSLHMTPQDLEAFKARGMESARAAGLIVDITASEGDTSV